MGYSLKKHFAGKFVVLDGDEAEVFGPAKMAECQDWIAGRTEGAQSAPPPSSVGGVPTAQQLRDHDRRIDRDLALPLTEEEAELRVLLAKRRPPDEVEYLMRVFKKDLAAGLQGARRERARFIRPSATPRAAA